MNLIVALRVVLATHALALLAQSGFAGEFLSGTDAVVKFHEFTAWATLTLCLTQIVVAVLANRAGAASWWLVIGSIFVLLAEALQTGTGYLRFLRVHVPLGVIVFGAVSWQVISQFRKRAFAVEK